MGYTTLTEFRIMAGSPIIANRAPYNGKKRPMLPENLATLKRLQASEQRALDTQCPVCFTSGCDHDVATVRVAPVPVVKAKPARQAKPAAAPKVARQAKPARKVQVKLAATPGRVIVPAVTSVSLDTVSKQDTRTVTVRKVAKVTREVDFRTRQYAFSDGPRPKDMR